jgi:competence ComEA-like helix-hairpin-helix protein
MNAPDEPILIVPRRSQPLIAAAVAVGLVSLAGWFVASGGLGGGFVHHDNPPPATGIFTVNVNAAGAAELSQLPGLGVITAQKIVDYRKANGPFASHDDLLAVPGIGPVTLEAMRPHLRPIRKRKEAP